MKNFLIPFMCFFVVIYTNILTSTHLARCYQDDIKSIEDRFESKVNILTTTIAQKNEKIKNMYSLIDFLGDQHEAMKLEHEQELKEDVETYISKYYKGSSKFAKSIAEKAMFHSKEQNLPVPIVVAVIETESEFNPRAVSKCGARGLMQVNPAIWLNTFGLKKNDLHEIDTGIRAGSHILRHYLNASDQDMQKALFKYVGGDSDYYKKVYVNLAKFQVYRSLNK